MFGRRRKRILFVVPDYHCSFILRDEFRRLGWKADVYVPFWYPSTFLYKPDAIFYGKRPKFTFLLRLKNFFFLIRFLRGYDYFLHYASQNLQPLHGPWLTRLIGKGFQLDLALAKLFGKKHLFFPSGCREIELKANVALLDDGNVCGNCWWNHECDDAKNAAKFDVLRRYFHVIFSESHYFSTQVTQSFLLYKSIDLNEWRPDLPIPEKYKVDKKGKLLVLHGFRNPQNGNPNNLKGSPAIQAALDRLIAEGEPVTYFTKSDVHPSEIKYYQAQADIIVEQLIVGWWGSSGIETMALGKPVVCYTRPAWEGNFFKNFPDYGEVPTINATTETIYDVLKRLIHDPEERRRKSAQARAFAERHYNAERNVKNLIEEMERLP